MRHRGSDLLPQRDWLVDDLFGIPPAVVQTNIGIIRHKVLAD